MRSIKKYTGRAIITGLALCLSMTNVFANTLSEIEVYQNGSGYGISLRTDSTAQMKKIVSSSDRMSVVLKDVNVSENLNTVYNNVAKMDNVTIQPAGKNDIKIIFKGKGISNSTVSFASASNVPAYQTTNKIQLNAPIASYTPVYNPESFIVEEELTQTSNPKVNEVLTKMHISREMLITTKRYAKSAVTKTKSMIKSLMNGNSNALTMFGFLFIAAVFMLKPRRNSNDRREKSIGLPRMQSSLRTNSGAASNIEREIEINKELASRMNLNSSIKNNYGVRAYQQSQRNPYMSSNSQTGISGISRRKPVSAKAEPKSMPITRESAPLKTNLLPPGLNSKKPTVSDKRMNELKKAAAKVASAPISKPAITAAKPSLKQTMPNNSQSEIDSMKFLESITKIYENSGRTDLAKGLKDNLRKAQMSQAV